MRLQLKSETSNQDSIRQSNLITVNVIHWAFGCGDHDCLLSSMRSGTDKDDLVSNVEARHHAFWSPKFSQSNDLAVYSRFPNSRNAGMVWTIGERHALPENDLLFAA